MSYAVLALAASSNDLYAGGAFTTARNSGDVPVRANYIAKWNGSNWSALGAGMNSTVYSLAASGSDIYAGGTFTTATNSWEQRRSRSTNCPVGREQLVRPWFRGWTTS